jgi:hypothetical protein
MLMSNLINENESARLLSDAYPFPFRFTLLGPLSKSPHHALLAHRESKDTKAYIFGRAFHQKLLTPDEEFLFWEKNVNYATIEGKQFKKKIHEQGLEHFQLQKGELESIEAMVTALYRHKLTREMLTAESAVEKQMYWFDPDYKVPMRGKLDQYILDGGILVDYKSTEDASFDGFLHSIRTYRYNVQAAMYTDALIEGGYEVNRSYLVAVEKKPPYGLGIFELPIRRNDVDKRYRDITIESGRAFYKCMAKIYKDCIENDTWERVYDESVFTF